MRRATILLMMMASILGCARKAPPTTTDKEAALTTPPADAIKNAYEAKDAKGYRTAVTRELYALPKLKRVDLDARLAAYNATVERRGVEGLESVLLATAAALTAHGDTGRTMARARMADLKRVYRLSGRTEAPHAVAALTRPGDPVVHYVRVWMLRRAVQAAANGGPMDVEGAFGNGLCTPDALAAITQRYGSAVADQIRAMCEGGASGAGAGGPLSLGFGSELSVLDCMTSEHVPTMGERIQAALDACAQQALKKAQGNPVADAGWLDRIYPQREWNHTRVDEYAGGWTWTFEDKNDIPIESADHLDGGARLVRHYYDNETGGEVFHSDMHLKDNGNEVIDLYDGNGKQTWSVEYGTDADGNVTVDVTAYDENGKPISDTDTTTPTEAAQDGWGESPECRELTLALASDLVRDPLEGGGHTPPPTVVNPHPDAPVTPVAGGAYDCLQVGVTSQVDTSFGCANPFKLCGLVEVVDGACICEPAKTVMPRNTECSLFMTCESGTPQYVNHHCQCGDTQVFDDESLGYTGGPPPPPPVDHTF
jgi:hypothetical protein